MGNPLKTRRDEVTGITAENTAGVQLRRTDWRFLLPTPPDGVFRHIVLLGGPDGLDRRVLEAEISRRVSTRISEPGSADAVVILHDAVMDIAAAVQCLELGGTLYWEVNRRSRSRMMQTPRRTRDTLRDLGLQPTSLYWAVPNFANCRRYLPLDVPEVLFWYVTTLFVANTPQLRALEWGLRTFTRLNGRRLSGFVPYYAITAVRGQSPPREISVLNHPQLPQHIRSGNQRSALLTSGQDDASRVILLPFNSGQAEPTAVLKVTRAGAFNRNTEREQETLVALNAKLPIAMRPSLPQPFGLLRYGDLAVGLESYVAGQTLFASSGRWGAPMDRKVIDLRLATNWLITFHQRVLIARPPWNERELSRWIDVPLEAYRKTLNVTSEEEGLFAAVRQHAQEIKGTSLPIVWLHNDFGPWNLYRDGDRITVIDWEFGRNQAHDRFGPALCDLLYLIIYWSFTARCIKGAEAELQCFRQLFTEHAPGDATVVAALSAIDEYVDILEIDRRYISVLLIVTLVERAIDRADRLHVLGHTEGRSGNQFVQYISTLANHRSYILSNRFLVP